MGAPPKDLLFVPLGGAGEIGMNLNLRLRHGDDARVMVDLGHLGVTAPGHRRPDAGHRLHRGEARCLAGLVLTHAHEDHIGAVP